MVNDADEKWEKKYMTSPKAGKKANFGINEYRDSVASSDGGLDSEKTTDRDSEFAVEEDPEGLAKIMKAEQSNFFHFKFLIVIISLVVMIIFIVLTGVLTIDGLKVCQGGYWGFFIAVVLFYALFSVGVIFYMRREYAYKK